MKKQKKNLFADGLAIGLTLLRLLLAEKKAEVPVPKMKLPLPLRLVPLHQINGALVPALRDMKPSLDYLHKMNQGEFTARN